MFPSLLYQSALGKSETYMKDLRICTGDPLNKMCYSLTKLLQSWSSVYTTYLVIKVENRLQLYKT